MIVEDDDDSVTTGDIQGFAAITKDVDDYTTADDNLPVTTGEA